MQVYDLKSIGTIDTWAKYDLLRNGKVIRANILYTEGYDFVINNGSADDVYREFDKGASEPYYTGRVRDIRQDRLNRQRGIWEIDHKVGG